VSFHCLLSFCRTCRRRIGGMDRETWVTVSPAVYIYSEISFPVCSFFMYALMPYILPVHISSFPVLCASFPFMPPFHISSISLCASFPYMLLLPLHSLPVCSLSLCAPTLTSLLPYDCCSLSMIFWSLHFLSSYLFILYTYGA